MLPGFGHLVTDKSAIVKATVLTTKCTATMAELLSLVLRPAMSITLIYQSQAVQLSESWLINLKFWLCTPQGYRTLKGKFLAR